MKKTIFSIMIILMLTSSTLFAGDFTSESDYLDIRVASGFSSASKLALSSENGFCIYDKSNKDKEVFQINESDIYITLNKEGNINILDFENNIIETILGDGNMIIGSASKNNSNIQANKNSYRDFLSFKVNNNSFILINHINIEKYLYGVVPKEVGSSFPMESIKAQAVAARTFAMANKNKHIDQGYDLCDGTHCQVYGAVFAEHPNTNKAVDETRDIYVYSNNEFANTTFHSNNGGYIESSKDVWGGHRDYLIAKEDPFSTNTTASTWSLNLTSSEVNSKISSSGIKIGNIIDIEILETTEANRVSKLRLKGSLGEEIISGAKLRTILGNTTMRSTWFNVKKNGKELNNNKEYYVLNGSNSLAVNIEDLTIMNFAEEKVKLNINNIEISGKDKLAKIERVSQLSPDGFTFEGRGYGHGVGMSQYGAAEMAKQGYNYEEILKHYYSGVDIINKIK